MYDAVVVGARCAGAPTAMLLARKGYKVLLVDRATFPSNIPHGHFIDVYPAPYSREAARAQLGVPREAFVYGFFGNLQPYKGVENLIDSVARLPGEDSWLIASGGGQEGYLATLHERAAAHPRTVLRTYRRAPSEDIALIMRAADVVTLPFVATMKSGTLMLAPSAEPCCSAEM